MSIHTAVETDGGKSQGTEFLGSYLETLTMVERLHRPLLDVIKDEFERLGLLDINSVRALLLFNIGENEVTAGELKSRGCYQGSNVSYSQKNSSKQPMCTTTIAKLIAVRCGSNPP